MEDLQALHAQQMEHVLAKLRAELLKDEDQQTYQSRIEARQTILKLMGGTCPEIEKEMEYLQHFGREDEILQHMRNFLGYNNNPQKLKTLLALIENPDNEYNNPTLQRVSVLRKEAGKLYTKALLTRITRRLTNLPNDILIKLIKEYGLLMLDLEHIATQNKRFRALVNQHYKSILSSSTDIDDRRKKTLLNFIDNPKPPFFGEIQYTDDYSTAVDIFIPLLYAVMNGHQDFADKFFIQESKYYRNSQGEYSYLMVRAVSRLGIVTYQPAEKFLESSMYDQEWKFTKYLSKSFFELCITASKVGNIKMLSALMSAVLNEYAPLEIKLFKVAEMDREIPQIVLEMMLFIAYKQGADDWTFHLLSDADPLKLLDMAEKFEFNHDRRKKLILDMLRSYIKQNPNNTIAANKLITALESNLPIELPPTSTRKCGFFKAESDLARIQRLAAFQSITVTFPPTYRSK